MNKLLHRKRVVPAAGFFLVAAFLLLFIPSESLLSQPIESPSETGDGGEQTLKIGLLITADTSGNALTRQAVHVVEMALARVNGDGGIRGKQVKAVVKSVDGNWGAGSRQSVDLIYEEGVAALLGFLDGRSAHLVEQVCTKAEIPFVSTFSPDPSLSRINIPWFFSTMPPAPRQASAIADEIYKDQKETRVTVISTVDYDMRFLVDSFKREVRRRSQPAPNLVSYPPDETSMVEFALSIQKNVTEALLFFGYPEQWSALVPHLSALGLDTPVYLPVMDWNDPIALHTPFPVYALTPAGWLSEEAGHFRETFRDTYGYHPGNTSYYLYDGTTALLKAINARGEGRSDIKKGLNELEFSGLSGTISFDNTGEIEQRPTVYRINGPEIKQ